jgi:hypothetical protein
MNAEVSIELGSADMKWNRTTTNAHSPRHESSATKRDLSAMPIVSQLVSQPGGEPLRARFVPTSSWER